LASCIRCGFHRIVSDLGKENQEHGSHLHPAAWGDPSLHCLIIWLQKLKKIILEDELGICADLDGEMDALVGTYSCEWTEVVNGPERRKQFRQFVNTVSGKPLPQGVPGSHFTIGANRTIEITNMFQPPVEE
jgi:hypothetical protein